MKIKGEWKTKRVYIDRGMGWQELLPDKSQTVYNHSPDGYNWGYSGSGPAQLALAILLEEFGEKDICAVHKYYQDFKRDVIGIMPDADFEIEIDLNVWIQRKN